MVIDTNTREELNPQNFEKMSENSKQYTEHVVHNKTGKENHWHQGP